MMCECILGVLDERAMRSARLFPSVFLFHLPILYNLSLPAIKATTETIVTAKETAVPAEKASRKQPILCKHIFVLASFPRADDFSHRTFSSFQSSTLSMSIFTAKDICLRHNAQFAGNACIHIRSSSSYVIVDYTFPLINIACALCVNEDDGAFRGAAFPLKIRSRPALVHLHCASCIRRPVRCVPSFVHSIAASSNAPLARTRFASRFASRCNAPRGPLHHAGLAATPSIRAPLPAIGSNQFQQRRQRRRPYDNGSLTCPHLPFSRSRTVSKKERRGGLLLWCIQR